MGLSFIITNCYRPPATVGAAIKIIEKSIRKIYMIMNRNNYEERMTSLVIFASLTVDVNLTIQL